MPSVHVHGLPAGSGDAPWPRFARRVIPVKPCRVEPRRRHPRDRGPSRPPPSGHGAGHRGRWATGPHVSGSPVTHATTDVSGGDCRGMRPRGFATPTGDCKARLGGGRGDLRPGDAAAKPGRRWRAAAHRGRSSTGLTQAVPPGRRGGPARGARAGAATGAARLAEGLRPSPRRPTGRAWRAPRAGSPCAERLEHTGRSAGTGSVLIKATPAPAQAGASE